MIFNFSHFNYNAQRLFTHNVLNLFLNYCANCCCTYGWVKNFRLYWAAIHLANIKFSSIWPTVRIACADFTTYYLNLREAFMLVIIIWCKLRSVQGVKSCGMKNFANLIINGYTPWYAIAIKNLPTALLCLGGLA